jgi:hypothetical protein
MAPFSEFIDPRLALPALPEPPWVAALRGLVEAIPPSVRRDIAEALVPIELAPVVLTEAAKFEHYQRIIEARGFTVDPGSPTVLAIRGMGTDGTLHPTTSAAHYDDTIVVLTRDALGQPHVTTLAGSTHPGQRSSSDSPDVTGDKVGDVGMIDPGEYRIEPRGPHAGDWAWDVLTPARSDYLPGVRDTDHDGSFSQTEKQASHTRGDTLSGVLIHRGGPENPWSIGCINLSQNRDVYPKFIDAVGGKSSSFKVVLLDANG